MKAKIIIGLSALLILSGWFGYRQLSEAKRYKQNWIAEKQFRDQERTVTAKELSQVYSTSVHLQKLLGIKPKQVDHWIRGVIQYVDTGRTDTITLPADTVLVYPDSIYGNIQMPCYDMDILLYKGKFITEQHGKDTISAFIYRKRAKKFLFVKYGKLIHKAALHSSCRDSVYMVFDNVKVIK